MKKILVAGVLAISTAAMFACDRREENTTDSEDDNTVVVDRDSVATEYEVTETVVDYDTTTRTKTIDADAENDEKEDKRDNE